MASELQRGDPERIGPYRVVRPLSGGGMGRVYLAESAAGLVVAVKVINSALAGDPDFRRRFAREIAAARNVSGEFTAAVVAADPDAAEPWLATVYVPGPTLDQVVGRHGPLPVGPLLAVTAGLAAALRAIHAAGLVHRDLKPSNVILAADGPRVIDFGVAAAVAPELSTGSHYVVGTSGYMSPEVVTGESVGPASDIFGLGALLTTAATGTGPFGHGSPASVMYRTLHQDPDLSGVPKPVRPLVAWCLAKPPGDRPSAAEVLAYADGLAMGLFELEHAAFMASMAAVAAWHGWISDDDRTGAVGAVGAVGTVQSAGLPVHTELGPAPVPAEFGALPGAEPTVVTPLATPPPPPPPPGDEDESSGEAVAVAVAVAVPWWAAKSPFTPSPPTVAERRGPGAGANSGTRDSPGDSSGPGWVPGEPAKADEPKGRHLTAVLPERAPSSTRISLIVMITLASRQSPSAPLKSFVVAPTGTSVTVTVSAPGLSASGDLEQELFVPYSEDSEPIRFGFSTRRPGLHTVVVRAFAGGTFLGELALQISVESGAALEEGRGRVAVLAGLAAEPGEVTLQVSRTEENRYSFQLIGDALYPVEFTKRLAGDPTQVVSALVEELRAMSARESRFASPALIRNRIRNLGAQLWSDVVPDAIRRQFWAQGDRIKLFTIASDMDTVPWELLYPVDGDNDAGFLVEQFPVVRRVYGQGRVRRLPLSSVAYVVPPGSPANAMDEVRGVRGLLPRTVRDRGVYDDLGGLVEMLDAAPSVLHFACHNAFTDKGGSVLNLAGGPLRPSDLAVAVQKNGLAAASPLVFFNACRTAGEVEGLMQMMGWAKQFMGAGAGAFIGSLWAVRSSSAKVFAEEFYRALASDQLPLGAASLRARQAISADSGDPTWLAYTVYGDPSASTAASATS